MTVRDVGAATGAPHLHPTCISNRLKEGGLRTYRAAPALHLSEVNKANRVLFAQELLPKPVEFWSRVIFSDEKIFRTDQTGKLLVRRYGMKSIVQYNRTMSCAVK